MVKLQVPQLASGAGGAAAGVAMAERVGRLVVGKRFDESLWDRSFLSRRNAPFGLPRMSSETRNDARNSASKIELGVCRAGGHAFSQVWCPIRRRKLKLTRRENGGIVLFPFY